MRSLVPADPGGAVDLETAYRYPALQPGAHWLRANMISSVDGAAIDELGGSRALSGPADRRVLSALRRLADVIVVGAGTVRADPGAYRPVRPNPAVRQRRRARGQAEVPVIAIVTASLDLDLAGEPFRDGRPLLVTATSAPPERLTGASEVADVVIAGAGSRPDPAAMVRELVGRGLSRILCEGGPRLLGAITAAGLLDELCLTISPELAGPELRSRILAGADSGSAARPLRLAHLLEEDGFLFARYTLATGTD
ncbi:MAG TPA: dihydrofolate reductase family protein [Actinomycetes bacterium]|nr:dihydrofolate reductase family protein [Actinomycetes bacterium]